MITILKNNIPVRHITCPEEFYNIQCQEDEIWVDGFIPIPNDNSYKETIEYKLGIVNRWYQDSIEALADTTEASTWIKQESEARAYLLDNTIATPFIDAMLINRIDHTKDSLVAKIIEKADAYAYSVGLLLGEKQKREKEILNLI